MSIYDHSDGQAYEENLIEYAQEDDTANRNQYKFPDVEKALPECNRTSLKHESEHWRPDDRRLLQHHRNGQYRNRIRYVEAVRFARVRARSSEPADYEGHYDGPPLPALLIVFEEHDAVPGRLDEESQHMLVGSTGTAKMRNGCGKSASSFPRLPMRQPVRTLCSVVPRSRHSNGRNRSSIRRSRRVLSP